MTTSSLRLAADPEELSFISSGSVPVCAFRLEDCWCGETGAHPGLAHMCAAPGCGATWLTISSHVEILRLPGWSSLRYQRTGLRVV